MTLQRQKRAVGRCTPIAIAFVDGARGIALVAEGRLSRFAS
jgi:hypothetical protein